MQYRRTQMDVELTADYEILSINGVGILLMENSIDKLMLMVHQPAVEISIGDIFNTNHMRGKIDMLQ